MADFYAVWNGKAWVGRCSGYPSVTYIADSAAKAIAGITDLVKKIEAVA